MEPSQREFLTAPDVIASGFEDFKDYLAKKLTVLAQQRGSEARREIRSAVGRRRHPFAKPGPTLGSGFPVDLRARRDRSLSAPARGNHRQPIPGRTVSWVFHRLRRRGGR